MRLLINVSSELYQVRVNTYDKSEVRQEAPGQEAGGKEEGIKEKIYYN